VPRVTINDERCQGHGRCALIAPQLFDVDESGLGFVRVDVISDADRPDVEEAVLSCPENAIALDDVES
jgi:ferredoxin